MESSHIVKSCGVEFNRVDLGISKVRQEIFEMSKEYFEWMNVEITKCCKFSIPEIVGMSLDAYVHYTTDIGCQIGPDAGGIYVQRDATGEIMAMGGLRRLPDGAAEIVRIFTRPKFRGKGLGSQSVSHLVSQARSLGYDRVRLDTAVFMRSAQKIYGAAGFSLCEPYAGAEPPPQLLPFWLYMQRTL